MENYKRVLIFSAHADDCEFFAGGLVSKLALQGAEITEIIATDNGRGSFEMSETDIVSISRDKEARAVAEEVGKKAVHFLGFPDGFLDETPKNELRRIFMKWIREVKPDLVLSFDSFANFESHPDHIHVARAAVEAVGFAHFPLYHPEQVAEGLAPHMVKDRFWFAKNDSLANTIVDISDTITKKIKVLALHKSQIRMMMTEMKMSIQAAGRHRELLPLLDESNPDPALDLLIRSWAMSVGAKEEFAYGEAYRVERAGDLFDQVLGDIS